MRVKYFHNCVVKYIDVVGASCPGIAEFSIYISCIVKYIDVGGASCHGNRTIKYLHKGYCEIR
jgi:hypothetical protein